MQNWMAEKAESSEEMKSGLKDIPEYRRHSSACREVGPNKVERRTGIETKEKRTKTRTLKKLCWTGTLGNQNPLARPIVSYQRGKNQTKTKKSHTFRNETGDDR